MDNNTQTQLKPTPLLEAAMKHVMRTIEMKATEEDAELLAGIFESFMSEMNQPIKLDLQPGQIIDCNPSAIKIMYPEMLVPGGGDGSSMVAVEDYKASLLDLIKSFNIDPVFEDFMSPVDAIHAMHRRIAGTSVYENQVLRDYHATLMALMQQVLDEDPFCEADTPSLGIQELLKRLDLATIRGDRLEQERDKLQGELDAAKRRADSIIQSQLEEHGYINAPGDHEVNFPVEEPKGPTPTVKKVDGRKKPAEDAHLSELAKVFNQKGVPGLGDLKVHLPQVARHLFGDGITSTVTISKQIGISMSDAAAVVKVAHACKEVSEGVDSERFMAAISEVSA